MSLAYYNENDPFAAAWLIELIAEGVIAPGIVDQRDIQDVFPNDLKGFTQCHFFAGIGVWSLALRCAGWPDDKPVWTASCPCQPFSAAGKGIGFDDERHLWPSFLWLVANGPSEHVSLIGEQVASKDGLRWLDLVQSDLEGSGYAFGALDTSAADFNAPFIGQRLYWFAKPGADREWLGSSNHSRRERRRQSGSECSDQCVIGANGLVSRMGAAEGERSGAEGERSGAEGERSGAEGERSGAGLCDFGAPGNAQFGRAVTGDNGGSSGLATPNGGQQGNERLQSGWHRCCQPESFVDSRDNRISVHPLDYWRNAEWLLCRDPNGARFRPVEPGTFPLVDARTLRNRLDEVRGAGNSLNIAQAQAFIACVMEILDET